MSIIVLLVVIVALFGLSLAGVGLLAAMAAVNFAGRGFREWWLSIRSRAWREAEATVTRSVVVRSRLGRTATFTPGIAYAFEHDGRTYTGSRARFSTSLSQGYWFEPEARKVVERMPKGGRVPVFFDGARPARATLERNRPGLAEPLFFFFLMLGFGGVFLWLGVDIIANVLSHPPQFGPGELPSPAEQVGGFGVALGALAVIVSGIRMLRERPRRVLLERLRAAVPVRAAEVRKGAFVAVFGTAAPGEDPPASSPLTGTPALYCRACLLEGWSTVGEATQGGEFRVRDESGEIVVTAHGFDDRLTVTRVAVDERIQTWADERATREGQAVPEQLGAEQTVLEAGTAVLAVGRASRDRGGRAVLAGTVLLASLPYAELLAQTQRQLLWHRVVVVTGLCAVLAGAALVGW